MTSIVKHTEAGEPLFVGDLAQAMFLVKADQFRPVLVPTADGYRVELRDEMDPEGVAAHGTGASPEAAMRAALGVYFWGVLEFSATPEEVAEALEYGAWA